MRAPMQAIVAALLLIASCAIPDQHFSKPQPMCTETGQTCSGGATDCCTGYCDTTSGLCAVEPVSCSAALGDSCTIDEECCAGSCTDLRCACISDGEVCAADGDCCGGVCNGTCVPLNASCRTAGNSCTGHAQCCSGYCNDDICTNPSFCGQADDSCKSDADCCSNICTKSAGALFGTCAIVPGVGCATYGEVCGTGAVGGGLPGCGGECCSRSCVPYGPTNVLICAPPTGCHPAGEQCYEDSDCCGGPGNPDATVSGALCEKQTGSVVGRCNNGNSCSAAGQICRHPSETCNANANCCSGNVAQFDTCRYDSLGIPRCMVADAIDCTTPSTRVNLTCGSDADCCGLPCIDSGSGPKCVAACVQAGGTCTTTADCCAGLPCQLAAGSTQGTCGASSIGCADFGQRCSVPGDCCNGVPCTGGRCKPP